MSKTLWSCLKNKHECDNNLKILNIIFLQGQHNTCFFIMVFLLERKYVYKNMYIKTKLSKGTKLPKRYPCSYLFEVFLANSTLGK